MKLTVLASGGIKGWVSVTAVLNLGVSNKDYFEGLSKACLKRKRCAYSKQTNSSTQ